MVDDESGLNADGQARASTNVWPADGVDRRNVLKLLGTATVAGGAVPQLSRPGRAGGRTVPVLWTWTEEAKLVASGGDEYEYFGTEVAVDGDTAAVLNDITNDLLESKGSAYVYTRSGGQWPEQAKLTPDSGEQFRKAVVLDGDTMLVGASGERIDRRRRLTDTTARSDPSAYVFTRSNGQWSQQTKLTPSQVDPHGSFGSELAIAGDTAVVGAPAERIVPGYYRGAAFVFTRSNGQWSSGERLTASDGEPADWFGSSVAVDGDTVLVGAYKRDTPDGDDAGAAYVFTRTNGQWSEQAKLTASDGGYSDNFGAIVELSGDTAVVVAEKDEGSYAPSVGTAYVYTRTNGQWSEQAKITESDRATLGFDEDQLLIRASLPSGSNSLDDGATYMFTRSGGQWSENAKLAPRDGEEPTEHALDAASTFLGGDTAVLGAPWNDNSNGDAAGSAYAFRRILAYRVVVVDYLDELEEIYPLTLPGTERFAPAELVDIESLRYAHADVFVEYESVEEALEEGEGARVVDSDADDFTENGTEDLIVEFPAEETQIAPEELSQGVLIGRTHEEEPMVAGTQTREAFEATEEDTEE